MEAPWIKPLAAAVAPTRLVIAHAERYPPLLFDPPRAAAWVAGGCLIQVTAAALADPQSFGVIGMRERAGHFGGRLTIDSVPGQGTRVRLVMPWPEPPGPPAEPA